MTSIALLGDSILDNKAYVGAGPDVAAQLRAVMGGPDDPDRWRVTLCAVDGTTTQDVGAQLARVPDHVTHIVLSLGGNDALENADLLGGIPVGDAGGAIDLLGERVSEFAQSYGWALDAVCELGRPVSVCTVYDANIPGEQGARAVTALALFNDVIIRAALARGADVIDLRSVCTEPADYANEIEPGVRGGEKIARVIAQALGVRESERAVRVYGLAD
ncbi:MAG: SGNH/GDSL hydrolase family protein [Nannocystales bacterium]